MVSETFPLQKIFTTMFTTVLLYALWYQISRQLVALTFPGWGGLNESHKRDFIGRIISITQGLTSMYIGYINLTDPILVADKVSLLPPSPLLLSTIELGPLQPGQLSIHLSLATSVFLFTTTELPG